jgi:hypothetical protein
LRSSILFMNLYAVGVFDRNSTRGSLVGDAVLIRR